MSKEIKQGDKVRVSKDAPKMYVPVSFWTEGNSIVEEIHEGNAAICYESNYVDFRIVVPIKYLLVNVNGVWKKPKTKPKRTRKVDAEAKEAKFKVGDKVRMKDGYYKEELHGCIGTIRKIDKCHIYVEIDSTIYPATIHSIEHYTEPTAPKIKVGDRVRNVNSDLCGIAISIKHGIVEVGIPYDKEKHYWNTDIVELVSPTEQTEEEKPNHNTITIPVEVDLKDSFWDAYAADLAKEIVLKVANKYNDPKQAAEYAVSVAKAVVEGLKKK